MSTGELEVQPAVRDGKSEGSDYESSDEDALKTQIAVAEILSEAASPTTNNANEAEPAVESAGVSEIANPSAEPVASAENAVLAENGAALPVQPEDEPDKTIADVPEPVAERLPTESDANKAALPSDPAPPAETKEKPTTPTKDEERLRKEKEKREEQSRKDKEAAKRLKEQQERERAEKAERERALEQKDASVSVLSTTPSASPNVTPAKSKKNKKAKKEASASAATSTTTTGATATSPNSSPVTATQPASEPTAKTGPTTANNTNNSNNNAAIGFSQADILAKINSSMSFYEGKIREQLQAFQAKETHVQQQLANQIMDTSFKATEKAIATFVASPTLQSLVAQIAGRIDESCTTLFNQVIVPLVHQRIGYAFQQTVAISGRATLDETLKDSIASIVAPSLKNLFAELVTQVSRNFEIGLRFTLEQQLKQQQQEAGQPSSLAAQEDETVAELTRLAERMTQHIIAIQNKIVDQLIESHELGAHGGDGGARASQQDPVALTRQIEAHLAREDYNAAFEVALGSQNLEILTWTLSVVTPEEAFAKNPLPQDKIIATIQQAGCSLSLSPGIKVEWLQMLLLELDESDSTNKKYGRAVLSELLDSLRGLDQATQLSGLKMLIRQVEKKLRAF